MTRTYRHLETKLIHAGMAPEDRKALGISDSLIRLSVGLESTEDMIADFDQALSQQQ